MDKAKFIKTCLFKSEIKYVRRQWIITCNLPSLYLQFRAIGINYNKEVKHLKATFSEKSALALPYKLEKATVRLITIKGKSRN